MLNLKKTFGSAFSKTTENYVRNTYFTTFRGFRVALSGEKTTTNAEYSLLVVIFSRDGRVTGKPQNVVK